MDTLETLKKILNNDILLPPPDVDGTLRVKEHAKEAKIKTLNISGVPADSVAFTLNHMPNNQSQRVCFKQLSCYLDPTQKFVNKGCDLVIVSRFKREWYVLISDLKSDKPRLGKTETQLKNSEAFVAYILSLIAAHYPTDAVSKPRFRLTIVTTRTRKGSVYRPNDAEFERKPFREVNPIYNQKGQAKVHFSKLIGV